MRPFVWLSVFLFFGCAPRAVTPIERGSARKPCSSEVSRWFGAVEVGPSKAIESALTACDFADFLEATTLQPLREQGPAALRLSYLPTFHHPIVVSVTQKDSGAELVAIELDGQGGYWPGKVLEKRVRELAPAEWDALASRLNSTEPWRPAPAQTPPPGYELVRGDQPNWLLEGVSGHSYRLVQRWSDDAHENPAFADLAVTLLNASSFSLPADPFAG